jgi:hypothetical protein
VTFPENGGTDEMRYHLLWIKKGTRTRILELNLGERGMWGGRHDKIL